MALSYLTESEAPRDFRVSSTESDGHYTKCLLCYTVKRNFYCPECIRAGNFVHSSMPYSDRYADKQAKLLRLKANRRHVLDRCEKLLLPKIKRDTLLTEAKRVRDKIELLRLAIEQRRSNVETRRQELMELQQHNTELRLKLPRYQKRVSSLREAALSMRGRAGQMGSRAMDRGSGLARRRRALLSHLTDYIFPLQVTYDHSDSLETLEFVVCSLEPPPPSPPPSPVARLHVLSAAMYVNGDHHHIADDVSAKDVELIPPLWASSWAALGLMAQLTALVGTTLQLPPCCRGRGRGLPVGACYGSGSWTRWATLRGRLSARGAAIAARAGLNVGGDREGRGLLGIAALCAAAKADMDPVGRMGGWLSESVLAEWEWEGEEGEEDGEGEEEEPPEHLTWPETYHHEAPAVVVPSSGPAPSLVTSAAASIVSIWRGWTK